MTENSTTFTVRRLLNAERQRVYDAFSQAESIAQWFKPSSDVVVEVLAFQFVEGGQYRLRFTMPDGKCPVLFGVYQELIAPDKLVFTWGWEEPDPHVGIPSLITIQLLEKGRSTELIVTHERTPTEQLATGHAVGWEGALDCLERLLDQGSRR